MSEKEEQLDLDTELTYEEAALLVTFFESFSDSIHMNTIFYLGNGKDIGFRPVYRLCSVSKDDNNQSYLLIECKATFASYDRKNTELLEKAQALLPVTSTIPIETLIQDIQEADSKRTGLGYNSRIAELLREQRIELKKQIEQAFEDKIVDISAILPNTLCFLSKSLPDADGHMTLDPVAYIYPDADKIRTYRLDNFHMDVLSIKKEFDTWIYTPLYEKNLFESAKSIIIFDPDRNLFYVFSLNTGVVSGSKKCFLGIMHDFKTFTEIKGIDKDILLTVRDQWNNPGLLINSVFQKQQNIDYLESLDNLII